MARRIVGLDLGAYSVKLVRLESGTHDAPFEVLDAAEEVLPSDNGDVPLKERQQAALSEMFRKGLLDGEIYADQPKGRVHFNAIAPFVFDIKRPAPRLGTIDLCGLPW